MHSIAWQKRVVTTSENLALCSIAGEFNIMISVYSEKFLMTAETIMLLSNKKLTNIVTKQHHLVIE